MTTRVKYIPWIGLFVTFTRFWSAVSKYCKIAGTLEFGQASEELNHASDEFWTSFFITLLSVVPLAFLFDKLF